MSRANPKTSHDNAGIAAGNFKMTEDVRDYATAREVFERLYHETTPATATTDRVKAVGGGDGDSPYAYRIGPHMWVAEREGYYAVVLYDTEIVRYYADGTFSVDNGGFNTPTTRYRLDVVTPDWFWAFHERKRLGLHCGIGDGSKLWPLDHETRIDPSTVPPRKITTAVIA